MVKPRDYQHMGLLRMQVQNQWQASSMTMESFLTVEKFLDCGALTSRRLRHINRTYQYTSFGERQIRYVSRKTCLKHLSPLRKSSTSLGKVYLGSTWQSMAGHSILQVTQALHSEGQITKGSLTVQRRKREQIKKLDAQAASK